MSHMQKPNVPEGANPILLDREVVNPYRFAYRILRDRLSWDMHLESWRSRRGLRALRNTHSGGKAVIVCNGPSLNKTDLSKLEGIYCFGLNKINLLFERSSFRPSCIVSVNPFVIQQNSAFFNSTDIPLFLDAAAIKHVRSRERVLFLKSTSEPRLARDCSVSIYQGFTVTCVAMQLAYHMGFTDVALIGCDHTFAASGQRNQVVVSGATDVNHFDASYFAGGQKWQLPDLIGSEFYYKQAAEMFELTGRRMVNATVGGKLEILPRMELSTWRSDHWQGKR